MGWLGKLFRMPQKAAAYDEMIEAQWLMQQRAVPPYWALGLMVPECARLDFIPHELDRWADDGGRG